MRKILNYSDIRYGLIGIKKNDSTFPHGKEINILCDGKEYTANVPSAGNYINRLGECHRLHKAIEGTSIEIVLNKQKENTYILTYQDDPKSVLLNDPIHQAVFLIESYPWMFCKNETNVRCEIIDPILNSIGWEFPNIRREVYMGKHNGQADYVLYRDDVPKVIIEAKSHDNKLKQKEIKTQIVKYWKDSYRIAKPEEVLTIVTNGQEWQLWQYTGDANLLANADIIISPDDFCLFTELLKDIRDGNNFVEKTINKLKGHLRDYSLERHKEFWISDGQDWIKGETVTERFQNFILRYQDKVLKMAHNGCFDKSIIATSKEEAKEQFRDKHYVFYRFSGNVGLYITADYDTYTKRMIVEQIIRKLGLEERHQISNEKKR